MSVSLNTNEIQVSNTQSVKSSETKRDDKSKFLTPIQTKIAIGTSLAALAAVGIYLAIRGKNSKNTSKISKEIIEHNKSSVNAQVAQPNMKMNDGAKFEYDKVKSTCDGEISVIVNDSKNKTLQEMAEYYAQEEKISSFPKLLENFQDEIQSKTVKDLWDISFSISKEKDKFVKLAKDRYGANSKTVKDLWNISFPISKEKDKFVNLAKDRYGANSKKINVVHPRFSYTHKKNDISDITSSYLNREELAEYKYLEQKHKLIKEQIQNKKKFILNKIESKGDKSVNCETVDEYVENSKQLNALGTYYDAYPYNDLLRKGEKLDSKAIEEIKAMDEIFNMAPPLKNDAVVYRAVHGSNLGIESQNNFVESLKEGMIITDKSYLSTAATSDNPQFLQFADCAIDNSFGGLMRIKLPKGTKGIYGGYDEYLLPRNSQIKINKMEVVDGVKIMDCEYILPNIN